MREWVVVASRAEAKIFERDNKTQNLRWVETLTNKKGRRREREFESDKPGSSYAKFFKGKSPHNLEGHVTHVESVATHFAQVIARVLIKNHTQGRFKKAIVMASPKLLGKIKDEIKKPLQKEAFQFIAKNIEKLNSAEIHDHLFP